jgi:MSHA biogenesis protein MshJ
MKKNWQNYSNKFSQLTTREQYLLLLSGLVAIVLIGSYLFIDEKSTKIATFEKQSRAMKSGNQSLDYTINEFQSALTEDPNEETIKEIARLQGKLAGIDKELVHLTTELISPSEMRRALLRLLRLEPGVSLLSFELLGAKPLLDLSSAQAKSALNDTQPSAEQLGLNLYKHGIKIKLTGKYFELRNYLKQLEQLRWKFFWQDFEFTVKDYPQGEVEIIIYSLGLNKEFIGV